MAKILIIDDEEQVRLYLRRILTAEGHEVIEAPDGKVSLRLYHEEPADLAIIDIFMPEKEGLETISALREDFPDAKIIAISGGGRAGKLDFLRAATAFGALRTLHKPFTRQQMLDVVQEVLGSGYMLTDSAPSGILLLPIDNREECYDSDRYHTPLHQVQQYQHRQEWDRLQRRSEVSLSRL